MAKKKAAKKAAPVKPERTRSRAAAGAPEKNRTITIDKLGKLITWKVPDAPYAGDDLLRAAFVGGFELRTRQVSHDSQDEGIPMRFTEGSKEQRAFEDGYNEAARQDGTSVKPRGLQGTAPTTASEAHNRGLPVLGAAGKGPAPAKPTRKPGGR